ncbi:hypothetical protein JCM11641_000538 [Rhodosporidiobolus odoratus]
MSLLRAASRAVVPSCPTSTSSILIRPLSTQQSEQPPQPEAQSTHITQRTARPRTLKQVSEQGGATAKLVALAVSNTAQREPARNALAGQHRPFPPRQQQQRGGDESASASSSAGGPLDFSSSRPPSPRRPRQSAAVDSTLLEGAPVATGESTPSTRGPRRPFNRQPTTGLGAALASRRSNVSEEARSLLDRAAPSFRNRPGAPNSGLGGGAGARKPRGPARPKQPRRDRPSAASSSNFSQADMSPLDVPSTVHLGRVNLSQLLRANAVEKAAQVKEAVGAVADVNAEKQEDRERARLVLGGDYSIWTQAGKKVAAGGKALEHARGILTLNPSVGMAGREALLSKVKEAL